MLSESQVAEYHERGATLVPDFLDRAEVSALLDEVEDAIRGNTLAEHDATRMEMEADQPPDGALVRRLYDPCSHYSGFVALSERDDILDCVEQLVGADIFFESSKLNMKLPRVGSVVEWHQDMAYGPTTNQGSVALLLYLDNTDRSNGCLQVLPGRHNGGVLDHSRDGYFQGMVTEEVDESTAVALEGPAGSLIFLHCMTPHSSIANTSDRPRRTAIWGYRAADSFPVLRAHDADNSVARLVRGRRLDYARFSEMELPVPRYHKPGESLYQIQERALLNQREGSEPDASPGRPS